MCTSYRYDGDCKLSSVRDCTKRDPYIYQPECKKKDSAVCKMHSWKVKQQNEFYSRNSSTLKITITIQIRDIGA